jgi:hypothetical protein
MNPAPDADLASVGPANFEWIVKEVADLAIAKARTAPHLLKLRWFAFLGAETPAAKPHGHPGRRHHGKHKAKGAAVKPKSGR